MSGSLAAERNADLRLLLRATFPDTKFSVRNGQGGFARVDWTDGPCGRAVLGLLDAVPSPIGDIWGVHLYRSYSREFRAACCFKAREDGVDFYGENEDGGRVAARWTLVWEQYGADDVAERHRTAAAVLCAMTPLGPAHAEGGGRTIAAAVFHQGGAALAALA